MEERCDDGAFSGGTRKKLEDAGIRRPRTSIWPVWEYLVQMME